MTDRSTEGQRGAHGREGQRPSTLHKESERPAERKAHRENRSKLDEVGPQRPPTTKALGLSLPNSREGPPPSALPSPAPARPNPSPAVT